MLQHHLRRRRTVTTKGGLTLPSTGLLLSIPLPNAYLPIDWDEEIGWESPMRGYQATPGDDTLFAAAPQLYDGDADSPLILTEEEIKAYWYGPNIYAGNKGVAIYSTQPSEATERKIWKYLKGHIFESLTIDGEQLFIDGEPVYVEVV